MASEVEGQAIHASAEEIALLGNVTIAPSTPKRFVILRTLFSSRRSRIFGALVVFFIVLAIFGPLATPYGSNQENLILHLNGPSWRHPLGTDGYGRDILTLLFYGLRLSLLAGVVAIGVAIGLGVPAGLVAGYRGGWFQGIIDTISNVLLAIPPIVFALSIISILGPSLVNAMIAIGILLAPRFFRVTCATTQSITQLTFIEACRAAGYSTRRVVFRHVLPNVVPPLLVQFTFGFAFAIVTEASLSFLGLGAQPPNTSLGTMIYQAFQNLDNSSWSIWPPSVFLAILVFVISSLGDSMQDALKTGR